MKPTTDMRMLQKLKIATWNIAGGQKVASLDRFDYEGEDIGYFVNMLARIAPDIVCLQETHTSKLRILAAEIAEQLGMRYVYNAPISPSHLNPEYQLGTAVLSNIQLEPLKEVTYPYPTFGHTLANGRPAAKHDKMVQLFSYRGVMIANTQMLPLHIFNERYDSGAGSQLAKHIQEVLMSHLRTPLIFCGDMNFDTPQTIYPDLYAHFALKEALPDVITRPNARGLKLTPDHILISEQVQLLRSGVVPAQTDHYLCWVEVEVGRD